MPVLEQLLDRRQRRVRLARGRGVHNLWTVRPCGLDGRRRRLRHPVRAARPQVQGDLPGQYHRAGRRRQQQPAVDQPAQMARRVRRHLAVRRSPHQPGQHIHRVGGGVVEERRHAGAVREEGGERRHGGHRVVGGRQPRRRHDLLDAPRGHARRGLRDGRSEPRRGRVLRGRGEQLPGRPQQPEAGVGAPHQGLLAERAERARERRRDRRVGVVARHQSEQLVVRRRVRRHGQRLRRLQGETVQALQGPDHRGAGACAGGELGEVRGDGGDQVRAGPEERGQ